MADNVEITAGSGTPVRTDEGSDGKHYQIVKLADGTADSTATIPGSATDGLLVNLGTNNDVRVTDGSNILPVWDVTGEGGYGLRVQIEPGTNPIQIQPGTAPLSTTDNGTAASALRVTIASDSTGPMAKETGGNLAIVKTNTDPLVTAAGGGYVRQDSTATIAKETGGNLATVKTNTDPLVTAAGGGYVRQDSTATIAKETGGNLATVKTNTDPLVASGAGGYIRQDSTATIAKETGGNLDTVATNSGTIKTNTDPLVTAAGGGYVRQDSTATIAKETGGNLATVKTNTDPLVASGGGGYIRQDSTATIAKESGGNLASAVTALQLIDDTVFADDAGFTIGTSKLNAVGGIAVAHGSAPDAADAADAGVFLMNRHRVQWTIGGHPNAQVVTARRAAADSGVTDGAIVSVSTGSKIVVTRLTVTASNANTVNVDVKVGFGTATLTADSTTGAANVIVDHEGIPPGGGFTIGDGSGVIAVGADDADLRWTCGTPTGGHIIISATYYTIET